MPTARSDACATETRARPSSMSTRSSSGPESLPEVAPDGDRRAHAAAPANAVVSARTRVGGEDQLERGREGCRRSGAVDRDLALLERLPQRIEHAGRELAHFIEEQHAVRRARDRAGPQHPRAAADERGDARAVMRRLERRSPRERGDSLSRQRPDRGDLECGGVVERRQNAGEPASRASSCPHRAARSSACDGRLPPPR